MEIFVIALAVIMGIVAIVANLARCRHRELNWLDCDECLEPHSYPICANCGEDPYDD